MAFGRFQTLEEVLIKFDTVSKVLEFVEEKKFQVEEVFFQFIKKNLRNRRNFVSENSVCEMVIAPILSLVAEENELPVWSHVKFDVSEAEGLTGTPDFLIAPVSKTGVNFTNPVVCVTEVKKERTSSSRISLILVKYVLFALKYFFIITLLSFL